MQLPCGLEPVEVDIHILGHLVCLGFVDNWLSTMFPSSLSLSKSKNVVLIYEDLLLSTKTLTIIVASKNYYSEVSSCHIVLGWPVLLAQVLPCLRLIFLSTPGFLEFI
jgi:hypothetical protein